ncbi:nicotinate phosphoribosyltransferase, partial [Aphanothece stagnina RSMan2012]
NRDTQKFAMKCSEVTVAGKATPICKDPITDPGKASKKGRLSLIKTESGYQTVPTSTEDLLQVVYENGQLLQDQSLDVIRQRAWLGIDLVNG